MRALCSIFITDLCAEFNLHHSVPFHFFCVDYTERKTNKKEEEEQNTPRSHSTHSTQLLCAIVLGANTQKLVCKKRFSESTVTLNIFSFVLYLNISKFSRTTFSFVHKLFLIIIEWMCVCISLSFHRMTITHRAQTEQDAHSA